jgi:hypothetical protein
VSNKDDEHSGQPSTRKMTENVEKFQEIIHENRRQTLARTVGISYEVCQILTENLNMRCMTPSRQHTHPHIPENHSLRLATTWLSFPILHTHWT